MGELHFYAFPPFSIIGRWISKIIKLEGSRIINVRGGQHKIGTHWWYNAWCTYPSKSYHWRQLCACQQTKPRYICYSQKCKWLKFSYHWSHQINTLSEEIGNFILDLSWDSTKSRYEGCLSDVQNFLSRTKRRSYSYWYGHFTIFLQVMYERRCLYISICTLTARSNLSSVASFPGYERFSSHPLFLNFQRYF